MLFSIVTLSMSANAGIFKVNCWSFAIDAANQEWYASDGQMTKEEYNQAVYTWNNLCEREEIGFE